MVQNEGRSLEKSNRNHSGRELSPWLKERLLEGKLHSARMNIAMTGLEERSGRLFRRILNPRHLDSGKSSGLAISMPFVVVDRKDALPPSEWQALMLLLSHPSRNLSGSESPVSGGRGAPAQHNMTRPASQIVKQPLPVHRDVTVARGTKNVRGKIEETPDHIQRLSGSVSQSNEQQISQETSESNKFESPSIAGPSSHAAEEAREISPGEESPSAEFVQKSPDNASDFLQTSSQDSISNPGESNKTGDRTADTGFGHAEKIASKLPLKGENWKKPLISRKKISGSLKQVLAGIVHRHPSGPQVQSSQSSIADKPNKDKQPEIGQQFVITGELPGQKKVTEIVKAQDKYNSHAVDNATSKKSERITDIKTIDSGKENIARNPGQDISGKELRTSGQGYPTSEIVSETMSEGGYLTGDINSERTSEQMRPSSEFQVVASRKEISAASDRQSVGYNYVSDKLNQKDTKVSAKTQSVYGLPADNSGRVDTDDVKSPVSQSKKLLSTSSSLSPGIVRRHTPDLEAGRIMSRRLSFTQPVAGVSAPWSHMVSGINPDRPVSDRSNEDLNKKAVSDYPGEIHSASTLSRNTIFDREQDLKVRSDMESRSESESIDNQQILETDARKSSDAVYGGSSQKNLASRNEDMVFNRGSRLPGSQPAKQMIQRLSSSQPVIGVSASTLINSIYHSRELPVRLPKEPTTALGGHYRPDNAPPIPGFNFDNQPQLDLPVAASLRTQADSGESVDTSLFRQPSDISPPAKTGYYSVPQPNITYVSRLAGTELTVQPDRVTDLINHYNQLGIAGTGSTMQSDVAHQTENSAVDLKALARDIYPYIKRMIMIEKERLPNL